jgi:hypothetical protein
VEVEHDIEFHRLTSAAMAGKTDAEMVMGTAQVLGNPVSGLKPSRSSGNRGWAEQRSKRGKSTPKVPVIEIQNRPQTVKTDISRPLTNQNRSQKVQNRSQKVPTVLSWF